MTETLFQKADLLASRFARWFLRPKVSTFPAKTDSIGFTNSQMGHDH
jgi:hypothetical protein